jgi:hypothetical protein
MHLITEETPVQPGLSFIGEPAKQNDRDHGEAHGAQSVHSPAAQPCARIDHQQQDETCQQSLEDSDAPRCQGVLQALAHDYPHIHGALHHNQVADHRRE